MAISRHFCVIHVKYTLQMFIVFICQKFEFISPFLNEFFSHKSRISVYFRGFISRNETSLTIQACACIMAMVSGVIFNHPHNSKLDFRVYSCRIMLKKMFNKDNSLFEKCIYRIRLPHRLTILFSTVIPFSPQGSNFETVKCTEFLLQSFFQTRPRKAIMAVVPLSIQELWKKRRDRKRVRGW